MMYNSIERSQNKFIRGNIRTPHNHLMRPPNHLRDNMPINGRLSNGSNANNLQDNRSNFNSMPRYTYPNRHPSNHASNASFNSQSSIDDENAKFISESWQEVQKQLRESNEVQWYRDFPGRNYSNPNMTSSTDTFHHESWRTKRPSNHNHSSNQSLSDSQYNI